jgi:hypothetical protein
MFRLCPSAALRGARVSQRFASAMEQLHTMRDYATTERCR